MAVVYAGGGARDKSRLGACRRAVAAAGRHRQAFFGAWRYVGTPIDGKPRPGRGVEPKGIIYYGPSGDMAAQIAPDRAHQGRREPTADEAKTALADYVAYFGTYTIDERAGTVTHHRQASVQPGDSPTLCATTNSRATG